MLKRWTWMILILMALMAVWGCSDDDDPVTVQDTAFETMAKAGGDYINSVDCPGVISASALQPNLANYTVIDIRSKAVYDAGHIPGAYQSDSVDLLDNLASKAIPNDKPYVLACYTGQGAGHAKIAMELMGYTPVQTLSFGMSSWNSSLDSWTAKCTDQTVTWETTGNNDELEAGSYPVLTEPVSSVVADRVQAILDPDQIGFRGKMYSDIMNNLDDYFIINYFGESDYLGANPASGVPGHVPGAYQFTPGASLAMDQMLDTLPTDKEIIVYCWTSQTSSQVTAYLNMLGYDAYSLKFGSNNLFYTDLLAHKWSGSADYPLEVTPPN